MARGMQNETLNNNSRRKVPLLNNAYLATAVATIFTLVIILASTTTSISASTTGNSTTTTTTSVGGEQEAISSTTTNNASNALLGRLFSYLDEEEDVGANVNPVNETYIVISYSGGNRIILPPNTTDIINATETANVTINIQPNGLSFYQGHAVIMTEGGAAEEGGGENATISFVYLTRTNPDGSGSGTGVAYFSTNSTGQLAFLDNMVAIGQVEYSESINRFAEWEWKGGTVPFENLIPQP